MSGLAKKTPMLLKKSTRKRAKLWLKQDHWFGVPRWVVLAIGMGLILCYQVYGVDRTDPDTPSPKVNEIVEGLRTTSVYAEKGAPGKVDIKRVRELIGDRPIVVVVLDSTPLPASDDEYFPMPGQDLCTDIADEVSTNLVILFAQDPEDGYDSSFCVGPDFSNPQNPVDDDNYDLGLITAAELSWKYRATDENMTPQIEEFVYAFDAQAAKDYQDGVPRRAVIPPPPPAADKIQSWQIGLSLAGIVAGTIVVFLLLRLGGRAVLRRGALTASVEHRRAAAGARLNRLAGEVLHPGEAGDAADARRQAERAKRYVLLLNDFENADDKAELDDVERQLTELELGVEPVKETT